MLYTKTLLAAASVAILTAVGLGSASAQPWDRDHRGDRHFNNHGRYDRHHGYVNRMHVRRALRRGLHLTAWGPMGRGIPRTLLLKIATAIHRIAKTGRYRRRMNRPL